MHPGARGAAASSWDLSFQHGGKATQTARSGKGTHGQAMAALDDKDDKPSWDVTETSLWRTVYEDLGKLNPKLNLSDKP